MTEGPGTVGTVGTVGVVVLTWRRQGVVLERILPALAHEPPVGEVVVLNHAADRPIRPPDYLRPGVPCTVANLTRDNALGLFGRLVAAEMLSPGIECVVFIDDDQVPSGTALAALRKAVHQWHAVAGLVPRWWRQGTLYGPEPAEWAALEWGDTMRCDFALTGGMAIPREYVPELLDGVNERHKGRRPTVFNCEDLELNLIAWRRMMLRPMAVRGEWESVAHKRAALHRTPGFKDVRLRWVRKLLDEEGGRLPWWPEGAAAAPSRKEASL